MSKYCFGIDVGGTTIKCGLFTTEGELVNKWEVKTDISDNGKNILPDVAKEINRELEFQGIKKDDVTGVGIGVPGAVDENGAVAVAVNIHWGYKEVAKELGELTGLKAYAGNDANVAALGEAWKGAANGSNNIIMVTLGTGVGGGIIVNGKILTGAHGAGGEIGHCHVNDEEEESCNCGNKGCLEQITSATGIVKTAKKFLLKYPDEISVLRNIENLTAKDVLDAFKNGDILAIKIMNYVCEVLGKALAMFATVADPEAIVVGGGVSKAGQPLFDLISEYYDKYAFSLCRGIKIFGAKLGNDAGIYGAARMTL